MRLFYPDCLMNMSGLGGEILSFLLLQNPAETMATELGASVQWQALLVTSTKLSGIMSDGWGSLSCQISMTKSETEGGSGRLLGVYAWLGIQGFSITVLA